MTERRGVTPNRTVRVPDDVWAHAQQAARIEGTTVSAYIVRGLRKWAPTYGSRFQPKETP